MADSMFEIKKSSIPTKKITIVIEEVITNRIDNIQKRLDEIAPDRRFNVNSICIKALEVAVKKAEKELAELEENVSAQSEVTSSSPS